MSTSRKKRLLVRLSDEEMNFIEKMKRKTGATSVSEALRFIVQSYKLMAEGNWVLLPPPEIRSKPYG